MKEPLIIGMDIGGTYTDAVLITKDERILASAKSPTTDDIIHGVEGALSLLFKQFAVSPHQISQINLGTTHATNAILQKNGLFRVGVLRIAGQYPESLPPCFGWPPDLVKAIFAGCETVNGGMECDGSAISPFNPGEVKEAIHSLVNNGAEGLAVVGVFSPLYREQEKITSLMIAEMLGKDFPHTISSSIAGLGFVERENATVLNTALQKVMSRGFEDLQSIFNRMDFKCPLYLTQNNGSLINLDKAIRYPILTVSAGPTNSFVGAARLQGLSDAMVVDIGGTSTDIGLIENGLPRRSLNISNIGGVRLNFSMPDVLSIALGGGSYLDFSEGDVRIGPKSAGRQLNTQAFCFGGSHLTLTDAAIAFGKFTFPEASAENVPLSPGQAEKILSDVISTIELECSLMQSKKRKLPIIVVGGGSSLLPAALLEERYVIPAHAHVANAFGAAIAEITGVVDTVVSLTDRSEELEKLKMQALQKALDAGADAATVKVVDMQIFPYHYVPGHQARVVVTASGKQNH